MKRDALQHPTQVRLPQSLKVRLDTAAARFGLTASELIRRAVEWKLPTWESTGELLIRSESDPAPIDRRACRRSRRAATVTIIAALAAFLAGGSRPVDQSNEFPTLTYTAPAPTNSVICAGE